MKLYFTVIGAAMVAVSFFNILLRTAPWYTVAALVILCTALQFALDGLIALVMSKLPDRWFGAEDPRFQVSPWEKALHRKLKVRKWKDKVWELGGLGGFSKKALAEPGSPAYIEKFIVECNRGTVTHRLSYPVGFLPMLFIPGVCAFSIACPVAAVNLFLNILPTLALRYNTPKLQAMLLRLRRKATSARGT